MYVSCSNDLSSFFVMPLFADVFVNADGLRASVSTAGFSGFSTRFESATRQSFRVAQYDLHGRYSGHVARRESMNVCGMSTKKSA